MVKTNILFTVFLLAFSAITLPAFSQNNIGIGTNAPNANAILDLDPPAKDKGFLAPRLNQTQRVTLATSLAAADKGLLVFDPIDNLFYFWDGTKWVPFPTDAQTLSYNNLTNELSITNGNTVILPLSAGPTGATGPAGANGAQGATGDTGPIGAQGIQGNTGPAGIPGAAGVQGVTGPTGATAPGSFNTAFVFNPSGTAAITDGNGTLTTTQAAWLIGGNTAPTSNNLGQTGNAPLVLITNNQNRMSVEANGDIFVAGSKPIVIRRFNCNCDNPDRNTNVNTTDWVAYVGGAYPTGNDGSTKAESTRFAMYPKSGTWWFKGDLESPGSEEWSVDVVFVKRQLVDDQRPANYNGTGTNF
ncbi:MAG: collagen-like protein [Chitinophagales bacterium]|nr:collagen-like protein [Chitinophagales bacterium]OJV27054.1 MAG: hypothetical protein BGO32_11370 [Bacteroidetes bacterium 37-13]HRP39608.1 hypothetical protein [Chitinophagales bacterium]